MKTLKFKWPNVIFQAILVSGVVLGASLLLVYSSTGLYKERFYIQLGTVATSDGPPILLVNPQDEERTLRDIFSQDFLGRQLISNGVQCSATARKAREDYILIECVSDDEVSTHAAITEIEQYLLKRHSALFAQRTFWKRKSLQKLRAILQKLLAMREMNPEEAGSASGQIAIYLETQRIEGEIELLDYLLNNSTPSRIVLREKRATLLSHKKLAMVVLFSIAAGLFYIVLAYIVVRTNASKSDTQQC